MSDQYRPETVAAYYKHQDGGLYRVECIAVNTVDGSEVVVYRHLWPFEGDAHYVRPLSEWTKTRFQPISPIDVYGKEMDVDREEAKRLVTVNKKARRKAEGR